MAANAEPLEAREPSHSGRLLLRMPGSSMPSWQLAPTPKASASTSSSSPPSRAASGEAAQGDGAQPARLSSTLRLALIANAVVVAIAAATAIALLVIAWR